MLGRRTRLGRSRAIQSKQNAKLRCAVPELAVKSKEAGRLYVYHGPAFTACHVQTTSSAS